MQHVEAQSRAEQLIRHLLEGTASETGQDFLRALVRSAAQAMDVAGVWVTEYLSERRVLRALAFWLNGEFIENFEYKIAGTPCELVVEEKRLIHIPERIIELFPNDADLVTLNAVSYTGVPLLRADGTVTQLEVYRGTSPEMNEAAKIAFSRWKFKPALFHGVPVPVELLIGIPPTH